MLPIIVSFSDSLATFDNRGDQFKESGIDKVAIIRTGNVNTAIKVSGVTTK
jgi:hypothetical protein